MPDDLIHARVGDYYSRKLAEHGATPRGVDWNSAESQELRFDQILRLIDTDGPLTINDVGCGYGALAGYLEERGVDAAVHGVDLSETMVAAARERYPEHRWTTDPAELGPADYTVCSGIFNVRLETAVPEWTEYVWDTLDEMHGKSVRGTIFNMLTGHSDPEYMRADLFYPVPGEWLDACIRRYGRDVALLHDYPLYEFTIKIGKEAI
jgi:SAM-dependent methyltransferase